MINSHPKGLSYIFRKRFSGIAFTYWTFFPSDYIM